MARRKAYSTYFLKRGRTWVAWTADGPGAYAFGHSKEDVRQKLSQAIHFALFPGSRNVTGRTSEVRLKEKLTL